MSDAVSKRSRALFDSGYYCAESVLLSIAEDRGFTSDLIPRIATGFCAGFSRTCGPCGALSGAIMALNLFYGRNRPDESVENNFAKVKQLIEMFEEKFGSTNCRDLIDCDLGTQEGQEIFKSSKLMKQCKNFTEEATKMALSLI